MSIAGEIAENQYAKYEQEIERLRKLVRSAYNEGFTEGMKEDRSFYGGKPWQDSKTKTALETTLEPIPQNAATIMQVAAVLSTRG